jgi:hypothetical protein
MKTGGPKGVLNSACDLSCGNCFFGGVFHVINSRLRNVTVVGSRGRLSKAISRCCGDLATFTWLAWAGPDASPRSGGDVFFRGVELPSEAVDGYRGSVGKMVVSILILDE